MIIQVTGDRKWTDFDTVATVLLNYGPDHTLINGYARGLDILADEIAREIGMQVIACPAHWRHDIKEWVRFYGPCLPDCKEVIGKAAGVIRNRFMMDTYKADIVLGFHDDILSSKGTKDMLTYARKKGVPSVLYTSRGEVIPNPKL
jgi:hypothetical protein